MKAKWLIVIVAACAMGMAGGVHGQTDAGKKDEPATALERFLEGHGTLLVKEFYLMGRILPAADAEVEVEAVRFLRPAAPGRPQVLGVCFTRLPRGLHESAPVSLLDLEELPHLLEAMGAMRDTAATMATEGLHAAEVLYQSKSGAQIGFFQTGAMQTAYIRVGGPATGKTVRFKMEGLEELERYLEAAIEKLRELAAADKPEPQSQTAGNKP